MNPDSLNIAVHLTPNLCILSTLDDTSEFNAIFATASIKAAQIYYNVLKWEQDKLPAEKRLKIGLIYSYGANDAVDGDGPARHTVLVQPHNIVSHLISDPRSESGWHSSGPVRGCFVRCRGVAIGASEDYDVDAEEWQRYFDVNVMSGVKLSKHLLPKMIEKDWGRIIFISSESGVNIPANMIHYGKTKSAQIALSNGLAKLTKDTQLTVNTIIGCPIFSDGVARAIEQISASQGLDVEEMKKGVIASKQTSLINRFIEPAEIASFATFLASPLSSAINGAALRMDGGVLTTIV